MWNEWDMDELMDELIFTDGVWIEEAAEILGHKITKVRAAESAKLISHSPRKATKKQRLWDV
jgi:hypothetical protein